MLEKDVSHAKISLKKISFFFSQFNDKWSFEVGGGRERAMVARSNHSESRVKDLWRYFSNFINLQIREMFN